MCAHMEALRPWVDSLNEPGTKLEVRKSQPLPHPTPTKHNALEILALCCALEI